jgi:hypothetical protein
MCTVYATAGSTLSLGTTGVPGATCSGDTYLTLVSPTGSPLLSSDDFGGTLCSKITYQARGPYSARAGHLWLLINPSHALLQVPRSGNYVIQEGCYSNSPCGGTVAYNR